MKTTVVLLGASTVSALLALAGPAAAGNNATVAEQASSVPAAGVPGVVLAVRVQVVNTGDTTWRTGSAHRLGAGPTNQVAWSGFPCGGYMTNLQDARVFLCRDVPPGQAYDFQFNVGLPASGPAAFSVRMVQDGIEWFGEAQAWSIAVSSGGACATGPLATPSDRWKLEIFDNKTLSGTAVEERYDAVGAGGFGFDWGGGRASSCAGVDNFGVRFSRTINVSAGADYRFTTTTDDGVRLWVDGQLLIDRWIDQAPASYTATKFLAAGSHELRMDYYENGGGAYAALRWDASASACSTSVLPTPADRWKLEIFDNRALSGSPVEQRYDAPGAGGFTFDWGGGRASNCTGADNFGIRFSRTISVSAGSDYAFTTTTDDGVRLWVDGQLLIDRWIDQAPTSAGATIFLAAGSHALRMDYYENAGGAVAAVRWTAVDTTAASLYGVNIDPANPKGSPSANDLRTLGARWARVEYKASQGTAFYDGKIADLRSGGIKILLIVDYSSVSGKPDGSTGTDAQWSAYLTSFNNAVRGLAAHYGNGVDAWQIWNEPDLPPHPGYDPYVPPRHFGAMLRDSVSGIRAFSSRPVVTAGLASGDANYLVQARDAAGGLTVDAVGVHPYGQRAPDDWPNPSWGFGNMSNLFDRYLAFGKPLWVSEIGVNTQDSSFQATYLDNVYRLARERYAGRVQVVFWFCWSDGMVPPFGLLDANLRPKPSYDQYKATAPPF
jgi:hypothetical protein